MWIPLSIVWAINPQKYALMKQPQDTNEERVIQSKDWRKRLDDILVEMKDQIKFERQGPPKEQGRHLALSVTHLEYAITRQGQRMGAIDKEQPGTAPHPYPTSYDPSTAKVEPTADGLKGL